MAVSDADQIFPNLPPRFAGRIRVNARTAPAPERAPIVQPPPSDWEALRDAYLAAPMAGLGAIGQGVNWGMDALTQYAAAQGATPLGALAPNWHPFYGHEDVPGVAERLTNLANDPVPFGLPNPEALAPKLGTSINSVPGA